MKYRFQKGDKAITLEGYGLREAMALADKYVEYAYDGYWKLVGDDSYEWTLMSRNREKVQGFIGKFYQDV